MLNVTGEGKNLVNLGGTNDATPDTDAVTALANIYKMFAAEGSGFTYNGIASGTDASTTTPTKDKAWLPGGGGQSGITTTYNPKGSSNITNNFTSTINGITWKAEITPGSEVDSTDENAFVGKLQNAKTVEITGTVTSGSFKYKPTQKGGGETAPLDIDPNNAQQLPSNIKTIKIVLKKAQ